MEPIQIVTAVIFAVTIIFVIIRKIDTVVAALLGVIAMVLVGGMTEVQASGSLPVISARPGYRNIWPTRRWISRREIFLSS